MALALLLLAALPALLLGFDHRLWVAPPKLRGLGGGLTLWSVGIASVAVGSRAAGVLRRSPPATAETVAPSIRRAGRHGIAIVVAIVVVCLAAFVAKVGGPIAYLKNLNNSAAATFGLTYFIWGISFAKFASFACLGESWARNQHPSRSTIAACVLAILLLLFLGSRLLLLVAMIQLLVLYAALRPTGRRFWSVVAGAMVVGVVAFVGIGEYRRWENVPRHQSFPSYFAHKSVPQLPRTYVNDYADAVRLSVLARAVVPREAPYEDGKEFLRVLLQPIPGGIRPTVSTAPALLHTFTSGNKNGNALPVPVEGYIEFGFIGVVVLSLLLGLSVGAVDRIGPRARDVGGLTASIAAGTGLVIVMRGSLHQGIALAVIDVIGFYVVHRILFQRSLRPGGGSDAPRGAAATPRAVTDAVAALPGRQ